ncbi:complement activation, classical pathway [Halocaridina rubra]|uniref:Complement activation, classical pathway n=1 Tax=Halocaridina rubra TaxID=373956 RepID=A0AAN8X4M3_HALRR
MRNPQLEFRLALFTTHEGDSGVYTCTTPTGHSHSVVLDIRRVECPPLDESFKDPMVPRRQPQSTTSLNTVVTFSCGHGFSLIGSSETKCLPSGRWSVSIPRCEKVRCEMPEIPENGKFASNEQYTVGDVLEITCETGYMLVGQPIVICKPDGSWSAEIPKCKYWLQQP